MRFKVYDQDALWKLLPEHRKKTLNVPFYIQQPEVKLFYRSNLHNYQTNWNISKIPIYIYI